MSKLYILSFLMLTSVSLIKAQLFTIAPNDTVIAVAPPSQLSVFDIYQHNATVDTIQLAWTKVYESIPAGWDYSLCDLGTCYPGFPSGGTMALVAPPDSGFLGVNVDPYALSGTLTIRFYVYETSAPTQGDTLTWIITAQTTGLEDLASATLGIFPNPTANYIQINTVNMDYPANVTIYDINGRTMMKTNIIQQNEAIDVTNIPTGSYILEVQSKQIIRKSFIKQ